MMKNPEDRNTISYSNGAFVLKFPIPFGFDFSLEAESKSIFQFPMVGRG